MGTNRKTKAGAGGAGMPALPKPYSDPLRFAAEIEAFEAADRLQPPRAGAIVCYGSSSMRGWHDTIRQDLAPLTVIPRGFGGSTMLDALHYADRVVIPCRPRAVVLYEGDNDIASGATPDDILAVFKALVAKLRGALPAVRVYCLSIKPSPSRMQLWPAMAQTNDRLARECAAGVGMRYIDVAGPMLGPDGQPIVSLFIGDRLHMTRLGYEIWRDAIRPVLLARERAFESAPPAR